MKGILEKKVDGWYVKWSDLHSFTHGTHWIWTPLHKDVDTTNLMEDDLVDIKIITSGYNEETYQPITYAILVTSNREAKINWIKWWLQRYGERDEYTFSFDSEVNGKPLYISMQYNYTDEGGRIEPFCLFKTNNKLNAEYINGRTDEELDMAIETLKSINKQQYGMGFKD